MRRAAWSVQRTACGWGEKTMGLPAFRAMAVCNQHLDHGPISIELDGSVILELADHLISDPGVHIEIGG